VPITAKNFATLCSGEEVEGRMPRTVKILLPLFVHVQFHALRLFVLVLVRLLTPRFWCTMPSFHRVIPHLMLRGGAANA